MTDSHLTGAPDQPARRAFLAGKPAAALAGAAVLAAGAAQAQTNAMSGNPPPPRGITDVDIFNFALNLEYMETEFYMRGLTGQGMPESMAGPAAGPVRGGRAVPFINPRLRAFFENILRNETGHVNFLRRTLGSAAVSRPALDFAGGFAGVAQAAGLGPNFDPFADETSFMLGSFLFEDVGITAYKGAAPLIRNRDYLKAAAGIHATEAYHMGVVRSMLFRAGQPARDATRRISDLRDQLDGPPDLDQPVEINGRANFVPSDSGGVAFSRTPQQVLNIVYGNSARGAVSGGFFPNGVNGRIQAT